MKIRWRDLWTWEGTLGRGAYALIGIILFAVKYNIDRLIASLAFNRQWDITNYWIPLKQAVGPWHLSPADKTFLFTMLAVAIPFIWAGVTCTVRRLRDAALSPSWVLMFFVPYLNLFFLLTLCVFPGRSEKVAAGGAAQTRPDRFGKWIPESRLGSAALAVLLTGLIGVGFGYLGIVSFKDYGWGLFVAVPFCMGFISVLLYGYHAPRSYGSAMLVSLTSVFITAALFFALAWEGAICIVMAAPIGAVLAMAGGSLAWLVRAGGTSHRHAPAVFSIVLLVAPVVMTIEHAVNPQPPIFVVRTAIEVNAPPEAVWKNVIAFTQLPPATEFLFRAGIAYPIRAELTGHGVGAERHCIFSTGAFVEPITVWDEPHLLKFSVTSNPAPMEEWTPYKHIDPPHLHGFLVSQGGQFLLTPLPGGRTRLEGTTWYRHTMWPAAYWQLWSDHIIHEIHLRVLRHIKSESESGMVAGNPNERDRTTPTN